MVNVDKIKELRAVFEDYMSNEFDVRMVAEAFDYAFKGGLFGKHGAGGRLTLKLEPYNGYTYFLTRVPTKQLYTQIDIQEAKEKRMREMFSQRDQRPQILQNLDMRSAEIKGLKLSGAGKNERIINRPQFDADYRPPPLPDHILDKMNEANPKWLDKKLDKDAEKPDKERRWT